MSNFRKWMIRLASVALPLIVAAACKDDDHDHEPEVETMRITIGATVVNFTGGCTPSVASVAIPTTGAAVTAAFLRADGSPDPNVTAAEFELQVTPADRFTRTGAFTGTLSGGAVGTAPVSFGLLHVDEGHVDFGPCPLPIDVQ